MHLFRIDAKSGGVGFHDRDSTHEVFAALALPFQFLGERAQLVLEIILLDCSAGAAGVLSLPLLGGVDLAIEAVLVQRGRTDVERAVDTLRTSSAYSSGV